MKPHVKTAATSALKWAFRLSACFVLGPIVIGLAGGGGVTGKMIAEKLVVGIACFPILFIGLWVWGVFPKKDPMVGAAIQRAESMSTAPPTMRKESSLESAPPKKLTPWNYIGLGVGGFMLLFLFLPQIVNGTLANQYYFGAAFWVGVIIYCAFNISRARQ